MVGEVWVLVYNPWTGSMIPGAEVSALSPCEGGFLAVTDQSGVAKLTLAPCPSVSFTVSKAGYREAYLSQGVAVGFNEVSMALIPLSGTPPPDPPVVTDLAVHVSSAATGSALAGALVTLGGVTLATNSSGIALYPGLALAVYAFTVQASGYNNQSGTVDTGQLRDLYVSLTPISEPPPPPIVETTVTARVKYEDGSAAQGVAVRLVNIAGGYDVAKTADAAGYAVFRQVPVGGYMVYAGSGAYQGSWSLTVSAGMPPVDLVVEKPPPPPPPPTGEIPVTWATNPPLKTGTYKWDITFQVVPIPFVSDWIAQLMAGAVDDQARLNQAMRDAGVQGSAEIVSKQVYYKRNFYGAVYEFTIQYKAKFIITSSASSLFAFAVLIPFIPAILGLLTAIVVGVIVLSVLSKVEEIIEGPPSPNLALIVIGAVAVAYLGRGK